MSLADLTIVTAGAGAGKTYRLTRDIIASLRDEGIPPVGLLATSFTKKAAGEILLRLQSELAANRLGDLPLHEALIGTVNSVCGRLLAEFAFEAGLSPDLIVLEAGGAEQMLATILASAAAETSHLVRDAAARLSLIGENRGEGDWQAEAARIVATARDNRLDKSALEASRKRSVEGVLALFAAPPGTAEQLDHALLTAMDRLLKAAERWDVDSEPANTRGALASVREARAGFSPAEQRHLGWADWVRLSKLAPGAKRRNDFAPVIAAAAMHHCHPRLREDVTDVIDAAFDTAIAALDAYAKHKREAGFIDFTDQETLLLDLLETNAAVRQELASRLHTVFVDEFQDTSPLQLALFLRLGDLARKSVWVGDPKQSIFGFRGADPALMEAVLRRMSGKPAPENVLSTSRRSRPALVELANAVFVPAFAKQSMVAELVALSPHRQEYAEAPEALQAWRLIDGRKEDRLAALAGEVARLLNDSERPCIEDPHTGKCRPVRGGDIAILCRDNAGIAEIANALGAHGIDVAAQRDGLLATPEARLALACLRRLADPRDSLAAAEIAQFAGADWLEEAVATQTITHARIAALDTAPDEIHALPPLAALDEAMARAEVLPLVTRWPGARQRLANLEALRTQAQIYEDQCRSLRQAATPGGFVAALAALSPAPGQPEATSEHAVSVLTYHRAKGLEWPVVIMAQLDKSFAVRAFGVSVENDTGGIDPQAPLAGRWLRYWPWPYGRQQSGVPLAEAVVETPEYKAAGERQEREEVRLAYVGVTRARDMLVLALSRKNLWLEQFAPGLESKLQAREVTAKAPGEPFMAGSFTRLAWPGGAAPIFPPLRVTPSMAAGETMAEVTLIPLGGRLAQAGGAVREEVGEALHRFLASDDPALLLPNRQALAERLLGMWQSGLAVADCLTAADRFWAHIKERYGAPEIIREWPVQVRLATGEEVHGRLDALIIHAGGATLIDHKTYPGGDAAAKALTYLPQLQLYRQALQTQGLNVTELAVHFPLLGVIASLRM